LAAKGSGGFFNTDEMIYLPLRPSQEFLLGFRHLQQIVAQAQPGQDLESVAEDIRTTLRKRHNLNYADPNEDKDDFAVTTITESLTMISTITGGIELLLIAIAIISLIVGGVGIMNIMYVTVTERTREIGLRKALGARSSDILYQFLAEAIFVTLAGGIIGIIGGAVFSFLVSLIAQSQGVKLQFIVSWQAILLGLAMAFIFGITFGVFPARKAASLDPIKALRFE
jgi:putative ABC transport system permease protein